jgi:hypothetical protein
MLNLGRRDRLSSCLVREEDLVRDDDVGDVRGDLGGTGKTMD